MRDEHSAPERRATSAEKSERHSDPYRSIRIRSGQHRPRVWGAVTWWRRHTSAGLSSCSILVAAAKVPHCSEVAGLRSVTGGGGRCGAARDLHFCHYS